MSNVWTLLSYRESAIPPNNRTARFLGLMMTYFDPHERKVQRVTVRYSQTRGP